ncbi:MAG: hypothetical protein RIR00_1516, partial [Pseudomonadota bacterium]
MQALEHFFSSDGPLAAAIPGYRLRQQQLDMANRVATAINSQQVLVAEAGTGTGKTFAYLVPAMLSGGKVIISTGTKTLQDQLFNKDVPMVRAALGAPVRVALLKGRANYVCHYHLERALNDGRFLTPEDAGYARRIKRFLKETRTGDKAECYDVPENSQVWDLATSNRDNCLGQECPHHKECFVLAARREALAADLVVVNHHLFFADVMLRDDGTAELLPACNTVIFDEAHQVPEVATLFFGDSLSTAQVVDLARDSRSEGLASARDCLDLQTACRSLEKAAKDLRLSVGLDSGRFDVARLAGNLEFDKALEGLQAELERIQAILQTQAERSEGLEKCWQRSGELLTGLQRWRQPDGPGYVRWVEAFSHALQLNATPLDVAEIFKKQMSGHPRAWVFTSATLAVQGRFEHYCAELGLWGAETACWESPFDYPQQAVLYAPQRMPEPNSPLYTEAVVEATWPVLQASG